MRFLESFAVRRARASLRRADRQRGDADAAPLNWIFETRSLIEAEVVAFEEPSYGRWVVLPPTSHGYRFQVDLYSDRFYSRALGSAKMDREAPASLVYSLHPNGTIAVIATGHNSAHLISPPKPHIDLIAHPRALAGEAGRAKVRKHLREFGELAIATRTGAAPTRSSERFLRRMETRSDRFAFAFSTPADARRHRLSSEANFSMGLVAGLVASTILPLAKDFGTEKGNVAKATVARCAASHGSPLLTSSCLAGENYEVNNLLSRFLAPGPLVVFALILSMIALLITWRIQRTR